MFLSMGPKNRRKICIAHCDKLGYVICGGCLGWFCKEHFPQHRNELDNQINTHIEQKEQLEKEVTKDDASLLAVISQIDDWEMNSIARIHHVAKEARLEAKNYFHETIDKIKSSLDKLSTELKMNQIAADFTEIELKKWSKQLNRLRTELERLSTIKIRNTNLKPLNAIPVIQLEFFPPNKCITHINADARWEEKAVTIAGKATQGEKTDQLNSPTDLIVDGKGTVFVCDSENHRIIKWKSESHDGEIIAGGKGQGSGDEQLDKPSAFLVDYSNNRLIISETGNKCITSWSLKDDNEVEVIIEDIHSYGLAMDVQGYLYVSDFERNEVRRYSMNDQVGVVVAGGNGRGNKLNQLNGPRQIFVDGEQSIYISDTDNHRVMKWTKNAKYGAVVAGGQGQGNRLEQLNTPGGVFVDQTNSVYVADQKNNRVVRWLNGAVQGQVIVGTPHENGIISFGATFSSKNRGGFNFVPSQVLSQNGEPPAPDKLKEPTGLFIDGKGNLYVADRNHHRIQRFNIR